jgi:hypothetical protein
LPVADLALDYLRSPPKLAAQRASLDRLVRELDSPGASLKVARMALELLDGRPAKDSDGSPVPHKAQPVSAGP